MFVLIKTLCDDLQVKQLFVFNNHFGDSGIMSVASCLGRVEKVSLGNRVDNNISRRGIQVLSNAVQNLQKSVRNEILSGSLLAVLLCKEKYLIWRWLKL